MNRTKSYVRSLSIVAVIGALATQVLATVPAQAGSHKSVHTNQGPAPKAKMHVPAAKVTPVNVPGTKPLGAAPVDLARRGYTEREFYLSGKANRYVFTDLLGDAKVVDGGYAYKTRMMVRKPANPRKFNGTVVVEWSNVTLGQDIDFNWATSRDYLMRKGYAVVSVSAQRVGVNDLKVWSPKRYGDLTVEAPQTDPPDPLGTPDVLSWDVFSQAIKALRTPGRGNALPGLKVKRVLATGESQGGRRLTQYYNSIDPLHRLVDGMVLYDPGYNTFSLLRPDNPTKLVSVGSEVHSDGRTPVADSKYTRRWEVAGTSHLSSRDMKFVDAMTTRDQGLQYSDGSAANTIQDLIPGCQYYPLWSSVPMHKVLDAAFDHVDTWMQGGRPAPTSKPLDRDTDGKSLRHTADGRTFGGVQLAEFAYPTAFNLGYLNPGPGFCRNGGHHRFYSRADLNQRYPDKDAYLRNVLRQTKANLAAGYILCYDAAETVKDAYRLVGRKPHTRSQLSCGHKH